MLSVKECKIAMNHNTSNEEINTWNSLSYRYTDCNSAQLKGDNLDRLHV